MAKETDLRVFQDLLDSIRKVKAKINMVMETTATTLNTKQRQLLSKLLKIHVLPKEKKK